MPFKSEAQRRYMWANHPDIAERWAHGLSGDDVTFSIRNGKAQWVRVLDVFVIGPLMVAGGMSLTKKAPFWGVALGAMGIGTVLFNARNWLLVEQAKRAGAMTVPTEEM
jgi:hypothetical protein